MNRRMSYALDSRITEVEPSEGRQRPRCQEAGSRDGIPAPGGNAALKASRDASWIDPVPLQPGSPVDAAVKSTSTEVCNESANTGNPAGFSDRLVVVRAHGAGAFMVRFPGNNTGRCGSAIDVSQSHDGDP